MTKEPLLRLDDLTVGMVVEVHATPCFWRPARITKIEEQAVTLQDIDPDRSNRVDVTLASSLRHVAEEPTATEKKENDEPV